MVYFSTHVSEGYVTIGLMRVLYNFNFELLVTNLLLKNFWFAQYAFIPRVILSLTSSSIEIPSFIMDPKYLCCSTCSMYELSIFKSNPRIHDRNLLAPA